MTMLDERLRLVGEELDRAAVLYASRTAERAYVAPAPPRTRRPRLVIAVLAAFAVIVGAALALRASSDDGRTMADSPEGLAIARNLGDVWLWPNVDSDVPAGTPEEITRAFASRVLGPSEFTVVHEAPDPGGMRIETPTLSLSPLTTRVPGPAERWVVYELKSSDLLLSENGLALAVTGPRGTASLDLFVRDASGGSAERLDELAISDRTIVLPVSDAIVSALVVFRNSHGEVIDAASVDAQTVTAQTLITCAFELNDEHATASLHATLGDTASATIGAYTARVEVVEGRSSSLYSLLRVDMTGPPTPGTTPNENLPPGVIFRSESGLSRSGGEGSGGGISVDGGRLTFTCSSR